MKLGEIITGKAGGVYDAPTRPVRFKVIGKRANGEQVVADAEAVIAFVPESQRVESRVAADKALRMSFPDGNAPADLLNDERVYHLLLKCLKDSDDHRQPFAMTVDELKGSLHRRVAVDLYTAYEKFSADEFPEEMDVDTFEQLVEEAKKKSLCDLLSSHGSELILRALPSLAAHFGKSQPTPTSGAGEPG